MKTLFIYFIMYNNTFHKLFFSKNLKLEFSAYMYQKGLIENLADVSLGIFLYIPSHYTTNSIHEINVAFEIIVSW